MDDLDPSLFQPDTDPDTSTTHYWIAYRAITLIPASQKTWPAYTDDAGPTQAITVNEGRTAAKNIEIHAEDIYVYQSSNFNFKQKAVSITCKRLICVPPPGTASNGPVLPPIGIPRNPMIEFDCSGRPSEVRLNSPANSGFKGASSALSFGPPGWMLMGPDNSKRLNPVPGNRGGPGQDGDNGLDGNAGRPGGVTRLIGQLVTGPHPAHSFSLPCKLYLNVSGGQGADGQQGGDGGEGGDLKMALGFPERPPNSSDPASLGLAKLVGPGGKGGKGGNAGKFGQAGSTHTRIKHDAGFQLGATLHMPRTTVGGAGGKGAGRGTIIDLDEIGLQLSDPGLEPWPPLKSDDGAAGHDELEIDDEQDSVMLDAEAAAVLSLDHMQMILARLQSEEQILRDPALAPPESQLRKAIDDLQDSTQWLETNVNLLSALDSKESTADATSLKALISSLGALKDAIKADAAKADPSKADTVKASR